MNVKIYQINTESDTSNIAFLDYDSLVKRQGTEKVNGAVYDLVFEGDVDCKDLEDVYRMFNLDIPAGYRGRSLSVSDVVEVKDSDGSSTFHYCDMFGFKDVEFDTAESRVGENFFRLDPQNQITVLLVQPGKYPQETAIGSSLEDMQAVVGGDIEEYMPFDDEVALICNESGKLDGLPYNRAVYLEPKEREMTYSEMKEMFRKHEAERIKSGREPLTGYIVFSSDSFLKPYSLESRTYEISSDNKAFNCRTGGYSIFGTSLDGTDVGVRLDQYMADERGNTDGWKVERCYVKNEERKIADIIAGDFFIAYAPVDSEKFLSLPDDLMTKYKEIFKYPERFYRDADGVKAEPYRPDKQRGDAERG